MKSETKSRIAFLLLMCLFGCLGPIVRAIHLPTPMIACLRAWIAGLALIIYSLIKGNHYSKEEILKVLPPMVICGILLAGDWIGLFTAYNYTTIASATICYYIAPILVVLGSVIILREQPSVKNMLCVLVAFIGIAIITGGFGSASLNSRELIGQILAVFGALCYAGIVLINRKYPGSDPLLRTTIQLLVAAVLTTPYVLLTTDFSTIQIGFSDIALLLILGVGLTAVPYVNYFKLIVNIPAKTIAIFSYGDPFVAVIVSVLFLGEELTTRTIIGAILVIGSAIVSEVIEVKTDDRK